MWFLCLISLGLSREDAMQAYLKMAYAFPIYGEVHFLSQHSSNGMELLAIGSCRIARLNMITRGVIQEWDYADIRGTHPNLIDSANEQTPFLTLFAGGVGQQVV